MITMFRMFLLSLVFLVGFVSFANAQNAIQLPGTPIFIERRIPCAIESNDLISSLKKDFELIVIGSGGTNENPIIYATFYDHKTKLTLHMEYFENTKMMCLLSVSMGTELLNDKLIPVK